MENSEITKMTFEMPVSLHTELKKVAVERRTSVKALLVDCANRIVQSQQRQQASGQAAATE